MARLMNAVMAEAEFWKVALRKKKRKRHVY
jgi:hypothetical protein